MAQQQINIGATANDGTGDTIRAAFDKVNNNFTEVYAGITSANSVIADTTPQLGGNLNVGNFSIVANTGSGVINLVPSVSGYARIDGIKIDGTTISTLDADTNILLSPQGTGKVLGEKIAFTGGTLDGIVIGGTTPSTGTFEVLTVNSAIQATGGSLDAVTIGATTRAAGSFTLVTASEVRPDLIAANGHIIPRTDNAHTLGSNSFKWANLFSTAATVSGTFTGNKLLANQIHESVSKKTSASGTVAHDCSTAQNFWHINLAGSFTVNFTNLNLSAGKKTSVSLTLVQGATPFTVTGVEIDGAPVGDIWPNGESPIGVAYTTQVLEFTIFNDGGSYTVFGRQTTFS